MVLSAQNTPEAVTESGAFIGPATLGSVPVKSTVIVSPVLRARTRIVNGRSSVSPSSITPSPSQKSSKLPSPSGRRASSARIIRSE